MFMGSRNGLLSFALLCGIGFFIHLKNKSLNFQFLMVVLAIIAGAITIALSLNSPTVQRAIYMTETRGGGDRVYYWQAGAKALWDTLFLVWVVTKALRKVWWPPMLRRAFRTK
jgi:hypothetical protein